MGRIESDNEMISYYGFYYTTCPKYTKGECQGCKGYSVCR